jgi:hypothetical protein
LLGGKAPVHAGAAYLDGYRLAMAVGAGIAVIGALVSLTRGAHPARITPVVQTATGLVAPVSTDP